MEGNTQLTLNGASAQGVDGTPDTVGDGPVGDGQRDAGGRFAPGNKAALGSGPPIGNTNNLRHGLQSAQVLRLSKLPEELEFIARAVRVFRKYARHELEIKTGRPLNVYETAVLQSCCRHETRAALAGRWLRELGPGATIEQRLALTKTISDASDQRDKCLQRLGLDRVGDADPWQALTASYSHHVPQDAPGRDDEDAATGQTNHPASAPERGGEKRREGQDR